MTYDLHTHTVWCDGKSTPEQMVLSAIDKGLSTIGILAHSYTEQEKEYSLNYLDIPKFIDQINSLKHKYKDKIQVLCGVEQDINSPSQATTSGFDYVLGSTHHFEVNGKFYGVDVSRKHFISVVEELFAGDYYKAAENYFKRVSCVYERTGADVIAHIDLFKKFNVDNDLFDESNPRYVQAYKNAVDKLMVSGKPFEINVGGIIRIEGQKEPYPNPKLRDYIAIKGGKFIFGSDSHSLETIGYKFEEFSNVVEYTIKGIKL